MPANPNPILCLDPTPPVMGCQTTTIFGAPKGRPGRSLPSAPLVGLPVSGIAIQCVKDSFDGYLAKACVAGKLPVGCAASFHYVIDSETGMISSLVKETDVAWSFQSYRTNFPPTTPLNYCPCPEPCPAPPCPNPPPEAQAYPGWTVLSGLFPNVAADFYTVNIGVTSPSRPEQARLDNENCCVGPYGMSEYAYKQLIHLIAWIQSRYPGVLLDAQHIAFKDEIVSVEEACLQCPCGANGACLVCDVSHYCERCNNAADPTISVVTDDIAYVFGESSSGCRVKISLADFKLLLG